MSVRSACFLLVLLAAIAPAALIAGQYSGLPWGHYLGWGDAAAIWIADASPLLVADLTAAGIATPVLAAGALAFLAPPREQKLAFASAVAAAVAGWTVYLWADIVLSRPPVVDAMLTLLDVGPDGGVASREKRLAYLENFATAGRLAFLSLGATLLGVTIRPAVAASLVAAIVLAGTMGEARAGSIRVNAQAKDFEVQVSVKGRDDGAVTKLEQRDGAFVHDFDDTTFASSAYVERIIILQWNPKVQDAPAPKVARFTVEFAVLLRRWQRDDVYVIDAEPFAGPGDWALNHYENIRDSEQFWTKYLASLQQADHLTTVLSPKNARTRRAYNTAVSGLTAVASRGWIRPPRDLRGKLELSFSPEDSSKHHQLATALDHIDGIVFSDLNRIETRLRGVSCDIVENTFSYLFQRREENPRAYALTAANAPQFIEVKQATAMAACAKTATLSNLAR